MKGGTRKSAKFNRSDTVKRRAITFARVVAKSDPDAFSLVEVYGPNNQLLYQCHYNKELKRVIVEEL